MRYKLLVDITARDLAMDDPDWDKEGGGYPPDHVIGPKWSTVEPYPDGDNDDRWTEVYRFANDPFAAGFVPTDDLEVIPDETT